LNYPSTTNSLSPSQRPTSIPSGSDIRPLIHKLGSPQPPELAYKSPRIPLSPVRPVNTLNDSYLSAYYFS
jgi:hypothetical protein